MKRESGSVRFLYGTMPGRCFLKVMTRPWLSKLGGAALSTKFSARFAKGFARKNGIDMARFQSGPYSSFNDFFTRRLKCDAFTDLQQGETLYSPCDGKASAYRIQEGLVFSIKGSTYRLEELLGDAALAETYRGGTALVLRLSPEDYHRYCYIDDGEILQYREISGKLHAVRPIVHHYYPVFSQNARVVTVMKTARLGKLTQVEVGALMVGKICNYKQSGRVSFGEEKGYFAFGGSTIVLLLDSACAEVSEEIFQAAQEGEEVLVQVGAAIGRGIKES